MLPALPLHQTGGVMTKTNGSAASAATQRKAFFITPIGERGSEARQRSDLVLDYILQPALVPDIVSTIERSDRITDPRNITPGIIERIIDADLVIADLTGANPNVYYELAIAHAFARPVVHIALDGETPRFDAQDVRAFAYGLNIDQALAAREVIGSAATQAVEHASHTTIISRVAQLKAVGDSDDPLAQQMAVLIDQVGQLSSRLTVSETRTTTTLRSTPRRDTRETVPSFMRMSNESTVDGELVLKALTLANELEVLAHVKPALVITWLNHLQERMLDPDVASEIPPSDFKSLLAALSLRHMRLAVDDEYRALLHQVAHLYVYLVKAKKLDGSLPVPPGDGWWS